MLAIYVGCCCCCLFGNAHFAKHDNYRISAFIAACALKSARQRSICIKCKSHDFVSLVMVVALETICACETDTHWLSAACSALWKSRREFRSGGFLNNSIGTFAKHEHLIEYINC